MSTQDTANPRQLVILSGKGGTGKTTVAAALAALADGKVLADCDVDAADLRLLLAPHEIRREEFHSGKEARVVARLCCGCGTCADYCRLDAIHPHTDETGRTVFAVDPLACEGCGLCALVCTSQAVKMEEARRGEWFVSETRHGPLVDARLDIGGENSGKLVTLVRNEALAIAEREQLPLVLVDGPPGIGCPAIASLTGADLVLLVTEPTVSGTHDLERIVELAEGFGCPMALCVNKADLNEEQTGIIRRTAEENGIRLVGLLPYDLTAVRAQVERRSLLELEAGSLAEEIQRMWKTIEKMLEESER